MADRKPPPGLPPTPISGMENIARPARAEGVWNRPVTDTTWGQCPVDFGASRPSYAEGVQMIQAIIDELDRCRATLEWYADPANYDAIGPLGTVKGTAWRLKEDGGHRARAALDQDEAGR